MNIYKPIIEILKKLKKIFESKIVVTIICISIVIVILNLSKFYYSIISLLYSILLFLASFKFDPIYYDFIEYWIAIIYLGINISWLIIYAFKKSRGQTVEHGYYLTKVFSELLKYRLAKMFVIFLYIMVSIGFLTPLITPQDPYEISNFSLTRFQKPFASKKYFVAGQNTYLMKEKNTDSTFKFNLIQNLKSFREKLVKNEDKIYFDSLKLTESKLLLWQGNQIKEYNSKDPDISQGRFETQFFLLGSDEYGRDVFSRMIYGTRVSLGIGIFALLLSLFIGITIGLISGYKGGIIDNIFMRFVDIVLAFPTIFLILLIVGLYGNSILLIVLFLGITTWMDVARLVRSQVNSLKNENFILAARASGFTNFRIIFHHILPNVITPVLVNAAFRIGNIIIAESALSFIGIGVRPPIASWGSILNDGKDAISNAWWISAFPGILITITVISFNFIGDKLREIISK
jgi:peptide/nickel transport system permease protein